MFFVLVPQSKFLVFEISFAQVFFFFEYSNLSIHEILMKKTNVSSLLLDLDVRYVFTQFSFLRNIAIFPFLKSFLFKLI